MTSNMRNNTFSSSLMFLLLISSSHAITNSEITTICNKTLKPNFCLNFLNSKLSYPNIQLLAKATLNVTQTKATQTFKRLQTIINTEVNPQAKVAYKSCLDEYESAIGNIEEAFELLGSGDGMGMNMRVSTVLDGADTCLDDVKELKLVDTFVLNNSKRIKNIWGIALVISNMLPRKA